MIATDSARNDRPNCAHVECREHARHAQLYLTIAIRVDRKLFARRCFESQVNQTRVASADYLDVRLLVRADDADDALGVGNIVEDDLHVILPGTGEGDVAVIQQSFQDIAIGPDIPDIIVLNLIGRP